MKRIVSLWLPGWPITRLQRMEPGAVPLHEPFALVHPDRHGITISAVNAAAAIQGIAPGTVLADARASVPSLRARPAEPHKDRAALIKLIRWAGRYGPGRNADAADSLWIDVSGVPHLFGGEEKLLDDLTGRLSALEIPAYAGLADTLGSAHALARFLAPRGPQRWALAPTGASAQALSDLPVESLRLDSDAVVLLKRLGLRRIAQLYDIPRESLARRFRSRAAAGAVLTRLDQALGRAVEPLRSIATPPSFNVQRNFAEPVISSEGLEFVSIELCRELSFILTERELGARHIRLSLYRTDGSVAQINAGMRAACRDAAHMMTLIGERLATVDAGFGIDAVALSAVRVETQGGVQAGFAEGAGSGAAYGNSGEAAASYNNPGALIDRLWNRLECDAVTVLLPYASHIPERCEVRAPALANAVLKVAPPLHYEPPWPYGKSPRRPPLMLQRPEPIFVVAQVPDGPPARFIWRRVERRIAKAQGPERIAPEWWRTIGAEAGQKAPRLRDYYEIEDDAGVCYWVYRHGAYGGDGESEEGDADQPSWFVHGLFA